MRRTSSDRYIEYWASRGENVGTPVKYAPLKELRNQTVFLKLVFREFYKGRAASGALFEDSEGLVYKMQMGDFEKVLQTGAFGSSLNGGLTFRFSINAEFCVYARGPHHFIKRVTNE